MLVLQRRLGERIILGDDIVITVVEIRADRVKLGIQAPARIRADLEEVRRSKDNDRGRSDGRR